MFKNKSWNFTILLSVTVFGLLVFLNVFYIPKLKSLKKPLCKDCNVILIALETLRSDHLPCYGYSKNTAPNICKFAEESVIFDNHYTQAPFTPPAYASLFTSLYPNQHGLNIVIKDKKVAEGVTTLASLLKKEGYTNYWSASINDEYLPLGSGLDEGFDIYHDPLRYYPFYGWNWTLQNSQGKKSFLFLHTFKIHEPYIPSNRDSIKLFTTDLVEGIPTTSQEMEMAFRRKVRQNISRLVKVVDFQTLKENALVFNDLKNHEDEILEIFMREWEKEPTTNQILEGELLGIYRSTWLENLSREPKKLEFIKAMYDAQIFEADASFRDLLNEIKARDMLKNSIIIIYSPMGEQFNEHGTGFSHSQDLYQTSIKTPLIIYVPGIESRRIDIPVESVDILPTILDLLGHEIPEQAEGISLVKLLIGKSDKNFTERPILSMLGGGELQETIIKGKWKLILNYTKDAETEELYDIETDSGEKDNLVVKNSEIVKDLKNVLKTKEDNFQQYIKSSSDFPIWIDEQKRIKLKNEGYF